MSLLSKLKSAFGDENSAFLAKADDVVKAVNALEANIAALSDADFPVRTAALKARVEGGESLDSVLPEAFALVREASRRTRNERHYDVQLIGGYTMHHHRIAEMKTGEGKTLVATLPVYLNALTGKGVHVV